jgi:hypothetical protein
MNQHVYSSPSFSHSILFRCSQSLLVAGCVALVSAATTVTATPYASSLTNNSGTVSFRLNESADNVKLVWNNGQNSVDLGALPAGLHVNNAGVVGVFQVVVRKVSPTGFTIPVGPNRGGTNVISTDGNLLRFLQPRGVAVNTDPASPNFGRVYVANGAAGAITNTAFAGTRTLGDGIYMLNPDMSDALGLGDTARTAGLDFTTGGAVVPYRLSIGTDGNLYVADWSDSTGSLYVTDPNVSDGTGANVLGGQIGGPFPVTTNRVHGSIAAAVVEGSLAAGNLAAYVIDEDLQPDPASGTANARNSLWRHDIGGALPGPQTLPTRISTITPWINFASQTMDLSRGPNGYFYVNNYRSVGTDRGGLYVLDSAGALLWDSLSTSRTLANDATAPDLLRATGGGAVSPRGDYVAVINIETNGITVVPLVDGIPDLARRLVFDGMQTGSPQGRDLAFDIAGNLYAVSQGAQLMRVFSPGGTTTATTGSDGTFSVVRPQVSISVTVVDDLAGETGADTATFAVARDSDIAVDLAVNIALSGSAINGTDYASKPLTVTIPAGASAVDVIITPIDDNEAEFAESVVLSIAGGAGYTIGEQSVASATIVDNDRASLSIAALDASSQERFTSDTLSFTLTRKGDTNSELFVDYITTSGSAMAGIDFEEIGTQLYIPAGVVNQTFTVTVKDDVEAEGNESVCVTLVPGFDPYDVGTPSNACGTILDNESPPAQVLFADAFNVDSSANWVSQFGANNLVYDAQVLWAYDYSVRGISSAPSTPDGSTKGLFIQVNKSDTTASAAALNLYPTNQSFSGNFALRFDMFLNYGSAATTEHALAGLNHSSLLTNRVSQSATDTNNTTRGGDGVWVAIETDGSGNRDYTAYAATNQATLPPIVASRTAASLASVIPAPPYAVAGSPGKAWSQIELSQLDNVVSLKVNGNLVFQVTNTTVFKSGDIMIGHSDQFDSIGSTDNFVIFDNLVVVSLDLHIIRIQFSTADQVIIDFVSPQGGNASEMHLQAASTLGPGANWTDIAADIAATTEGFRATTTRTPGTQFFRIRR